MTSAFAFMLSAAAAQPFDVPRELVRPEVAVERLKSCGFEHVAVRDDRELQEDVLVVSGINEASERQLRCAAETSLSSIMYVEFPNSLNQRYEQLYWRMEKDKDLRNARVWLEQRGLLAKLPTYRKGKVDDLVFARQLESLCGPKAKGIFIRDRGIITMKLGAPDNPSMDDQTLVCLTNVANVSGFPVGFIGNEFYAEDKKPPRE
jgi:hypothetical protein